MASSKLRNLILLLLVVINGLLLWMAMPMMSQENNEAQAKEQQLTDLFAQYGVTYGQETLPQNQILYAAELTMEPQAQATVVRGLLGENPIEMDSGTTQTQTYQSEQGTVTLSRDTTITGQFTTYDATNQMEAKVAALTAAMGMDSTVDTALRKAPGSYVVTATQTLFGVPYFTSRLDFTFDRGLLKSLSGNAILGGVDFTRPDDTPCMDYVDALVAFFAKRNDLGWVGSHIISVSQGFVRADMASAATIRLIPGWKIVTDTGDFWVNGISGAVELWSNESEL